MARAWIAGPPPGRGRYWVAYGWLPNRDDITHHMPLDPPDAPLHQHYPTRT